MRDALQKLMDICDSNEHCCTCPLYDDHATVIDEACQISAPPYCWDLDSIMAALEKVEKEVEH